MPQDLIDPLGLFGEIAPGKQEPYFLAGSPAAPFGWYGGKAYYAEWILSHFPDHRVYVEPFGGAANVILRKRRSDVEIYNDLDHRLVNFFRVLRNREQFAELIRLSTLTPYSREEFARLTEIPEPADAVEAAWWFFVRCRQAMGGAGMTKLYPCHWAASTRARRNMAEPVSKYLSAIDGLEDVASRFRTVMVDCLPAIELVEKYDADDVLFYCDPPYVPQTRYLQKANTYGKEMTLDDHANLLDALLACKAKVMISGYDSPLYLEKLRHWTRVTITGTVHMSNSGQERVEVMWLNC
ncbi:MAG TPA: DNA adenine methylase [Tepidisphaeraceae bacterium]|jgi:DNA adenine methylase|nr:DNA adenine methylase [Tepidisphaeraceae bacterium]